MTTPAEIREAIEAAGFEYRGNDVGLAQLAERLDGWGGVGVVLHRPKASQWASNYGQIRRCANVDRCGGEIIVSLTSKVRFCSGACRQHAYRQRRDRVGS